MRHFCWPELDSTTYLWITREGMHESIWDIFPVPGAGYSQIKNGIYAEQSPTEIFLWYAWINLQWIIFPDTWVAFPEACFSHPSPMGNKPWLWWSFLAVHFAWPWSSTLLLNSSNTCPNNIVFHWHQGAGKVWVVFSLCPPSCPKPPGQTACRRNTSALTERQ